MTPFRQIRRAVIAGTIATLGLAATVGQATAQDYPTKPVTLIIPYGAGGSTDTMGRVFANALGNALGEPVVVVNRKGGGDTPANDHSKNQHPAVPYPPFELFPVLG